MNLVKEIRTNKLAIEIYSINPNLTISDDASRFEDKDDYQIRDIVLNEMGAEEVRIYDLTTEGDRTNQRGFALI